MPHSTLKLLPGVDENRTIALNEAAISYSQLVRFVPDKQGLGLVQSLADGQGFSRLMSAQLSALFGHGKTPITSIISLLERSLVRHP